MNEAQIYTLIASIGGDAKDVLMTYMVLEYGSLWVLIGLVIWGVRTIWKNRNEL